MAAHAGADRMQARHDGQPAAHQTCSCCLQTIVINSFCNPPSCKRAKPPPPLSFVKANARQLPRRQLGIQVNGVGSPNLAKDDQLLSTCECNINKLYITAPACTPLGPQQPLLTAPRRGRPVSGSRDSLSAPQIASLQLFTHTACRAAAERNAGSQRAAGFPCRLQPRLRRQRPCCRNC